VTVRDRMVEEPVRLAVAAVWASMRRLAPYPASTSKMAITIKMGLSENSSGVCLHTVHDVSEHINSSYESITLLFSFSFNHFI
jgi:hypothetical protein